MRRSSLRLPASGLLAGGLFVLATAAWSPVRAEAPPVDEAGARALAASLKSGLVRWFPAPTEDSDGAGFEWEGEPTVKPAGNHYDVALPRLSAEDAEGARIEIGTVRLTVTPQDAGLFGVTLTLPAAISFLTLDEEEEEYAETATLALGSQSFTGTWSSALETLLTVNAAYKDLVVTSASGKGQVSIGSVTLVQDLKPDAATGGASTWSGPSALAIGAVAARDQAKRELFRLGGLAVESNFVRADLAKISALQKLSQQAAAASKPPTTAEVLPMMRGLIGGFHGKLRLNDLRAEGGDEASTVSLGQMAFQGGIEDLDQALSTFRFGLEAQNFALAPSPIPAQFTPKGIDLQIAAAKLPNAALWQSFSELIVAAEAEEKAKAEPPAKPAGKDKKAKAPPPPSPTDAAGEAALARTMAAMSEAGSELRLDKLSVDTPATAGSATGALRVAANTAHGVIGSSTILLRGLDAAVKAMQPPPGKKPDEDTQNILGMLSMVQMLGQAAKDDTGAEIRSYKIDVNETGQFLLNGADMGPLLGAGTPPAPAEEPKKKK